MSFFMIFPVKRNLIDEKNKITEHRFVKAVYATRMKTSLNGIVLNTDMLRNI